MCDVRGDINQPRFVYVTFENGTRAMVSRIEDDEEGVSVVLHSTWKEIICDAGPWDYSGSIYTTRAMSITRKEETILLSYYFIFP